MAEAYIGIGSNIEPERNIERALDLLSRSVSLAALSSFYRTEAIGRPGDPPYVNGIVLVETDLSPHELKFGVLRVIEARLGRIRSGDAYAARTIDLDVLLYGGLSLHGEGLEIPSPDILSRPFLAAALLELDPTLVLSESDRALEDIARSGEHATIELLRDFSGEMRGRIDGLKAGNHEL